MSPARSDPCTGYDVTVQYKLKSWTSVFNTWHTGKFLDYDETGDGIIQTESSMCPEDKKKRKTYSIACFTSTFKDRIKDQGTVKCRVKQTCTKWEPNTRKQRVEIELRKIDPAVLSCPRPCSKMTPLKDCSKIEFQKCCEASYNPNCIWSKRDVYGPVIDIPTSGLIENKCYAACDRFSPIAAHGNVKGGDCEKNGHCMLVKDEAVIRARGDLSCQLKLQQCTKASNRALCRSFPGCYWDRPNTKCVWDPTLICSRITTEVYCVNNPKCSWAGGKCTGAAPAGMEMSVATAAPTTASNKILAFFVGVICASMMMRVSCRKHKGDSLDVALL